MALTDNETCPESDRGRPWLSRHSSACPCDTAGLDYTRHCTGAHAVYQDYFPHSRVPYDGAPSLALSAPRSLPAVALPDRARQRDGGEMVEADPLSPGAAHEVAVQTRCNAHHEATAIGTRLSVCCPRCALF